MTTPLDHCKHNASFRTIVNPSHQHIPRIAFSFYKSKYEEPTKSEGFDDIIKVSFVPEFEDDDSRRIYSYYLSDS
uniref:Ovule protein n=1 Tax=Steinernema glaseri TaxID=37863 RepID=A0A1I7ZRD2_9BILA